MYPTLTQIEDPRKITGMLLSCLQARDKYVVCRSPLDLQVPGAKMAENRPLEAETLEKLKVEWRAGLVHLITPEGESLYERPSLAEFYEDMGMLLRTRSHFAVDSFCYDRLQRLETRFRLNSMENEAGEIAELKTNKHRDFYNIRKVDCNVRLAGGMNAKVLINFMKETIKTQGDQEVLEGRTLNQVCDDLETDHQVLSLDQIDLVTESRFFNRFDKFNARYAPFGRSELRSIFLSHDTLNQGEFMGQLTRLMFDNLERNKYQLTEYRVPIYGMNSNEWHILAHWMETHQLYSDKNRWMIQIPRLYSLYKQMNLVQTFGEVLVNIFGPLFECTLNPTGDNAELHRFLTQVSGFDLVDDEGKQNKPLDRVNSSQQWTPCRWNIRDDPSYKYVCYFIQTNLQVLNGLRASLGLNTFKFRPTCGGAGENHHLDTGFLLADSISHGIHLKSCAALQYLFYLHRVGVAMSPICNSALLIKLHKNPFQELFRLGLNVCLATEDPLLYHATEETLVEEYSVARHIWKLTTVDLCEIARNSVLISGFPDEDRIHWLGTDDPNVNNINATNLANTRFNFRQKCLKEEWAHLIDPGQIPGYSIRSPVGEKSSSASEFEDLDLHFRM